MSTTLEKTPATPAPHASDPVRFVSLRANLMPQEVLGARRAAVVRRRVLTGLVALVVLLAALYGLSWWQTRSARNDLAATQRERSQLQSQVAQFAPIVSAQSQTTAIQSQLQHLMAGDLSWSAMLTTLRTAAPAGVSITSVSGTTTAGGGAGGAGTNTGYQALNQTGKQQIGSLTLTGSAGDQRAVASFADALTRVKGLAAPFVSTVTSNGHDVTFGLTVLITADALGGRYTPAGGH